MCYSGNVMKSPANQTDIRQLVSLGDLAKRLNINKSQLSYYAKIGILIPVSEYGKMRLYDHKRAVMSLKTVEEAQLKGDLTLTQIAKALKSK
jgi:DNA-binding transcriptional MerR regulator